MTPQEHEDMVNYLVKLAQLVEAKIDSLDIQQVFMNHTVMPSVHYSTNIDFLINNYFQTRDSIDDAKSDILPLLVEFRKTNGEDITGLPYKEFKAKLIRNYKSDCVRYLSNWCNLSFSSN